MTAADVAPELTAPAILAAAALIMFLAGFIKGVVGFALPMVVIAGIGSLLPAQETVALMILPAVVSNLWQTLRQGLGPAVETGRRWWKLNLILVILILAIAQVVPGLPSETLFLALGTIVCIAAAVQLAGWRPVVAPEPMAQLRAEIAAGTVGGICGGIAGVWGPAVVFYLTALRVAKQEMIRAQGLTYFLGSCMLLGAHLKSGLLNAATLPVSAAMCLPVGLGMWAGMQVQDRLDPVLFRKVTLAVLCVAGLNLLRRGLF